MTTVFEAAVTCAVCGREQRVQEMGSTSSCGPMDLDTRPPPVRRHSLWLWVHECEECGFVAPELRTSAPTDARHVASKAYRYCQAGLTLANLPPFMKRLLLFERRLAVECDPACHTVAEAQGEPDAGDEASAETLH